MNPITPAERERLTLEAMDAVEQLDTGAFTAEELLMLTGPELIAGLVLLVNLHEAMWTMTGRDVDAIRESCRTTARAWRNHANGKQEA